MTPVAGSLAPEAEQRHHTYTSIEAWGAPEGGQKKKDTRQAKLLTVV